MSLGIAGGLDPSLAPGQVVIATEIIDDLGMPYRCHESWRSELVEALKVCSPIAAPLAGYDNVVATVSEKAAIHAVSNAVAVDTESHDVAYVAAQSDLPFAAIRVIADTAMRTLPSAALAGDTGQGKIRYTAVFRELARHPLQISDLVRLGLDTRKAMAALGRCAKVLFGGG